MHHNTDKAITRAHTVCCPVREVECAQVLRGHFGPDDAICNTCSTSDLWELNWPGESLSPDCWPHAGSGV